MKKHKKDEKKPKKEKHHISMHDREMDKENLTKAGKAKKSGKK